MSEKKWKVAVITGSRSEYGILRPVIKALQGDGTFDVKVCVTDSHVDGSFGDAERLLREDGFDVSGRFSATEVSSGERILPEGVRERLRGIVLAGSLVWRAKNFGVAIINLAHGLDVVKPDLVILEGDRSDIFAAAVAAAHLGMIIAHLGGGDSCYGGLDESFRHAITKLAHIHFPATEKAKKRIVRMGEREDMVFAVGEPALDVALNVELPSREEVCKKVGLDPKRPFMIVLQHPVTTQVEDAAEQMETTLRAVAQFDMQEFVIHPNADAGRWSMVEKIETYKRRDENFVVLPSVPHEEFLSLLKHAAVLVGNSSSGIIEAPSFKTPAVNVGQRQVGREMAGNVINVGHSVKAIREGIKKALHDEEFRRRLRRVKNPYGDGKASEKIVEKLKEIAGTKGLLRDLVQKKITY